MASPAAAVPLLFFTGQCTSRARGWLAGWLVRHPRGLVAYSFPAFNRPQSDGELTHWKALWGAEPGRHFFFDVPCFDPAYRRLCRMIVERLRRRATPEQMELLPRIGLDRGLVQHVDPAGKKNGLLHAGQHLTAMAEEPGRTPDAPLRLRAVAEAVHKFVLAFVRFAAETPDAALTPPVWTALLSEHVPRADCIEDKDQLEVDRVLELFGATREEAKEVADRERRREGKDAKSCDLKLRFLSKLLTGYGVVGCVADTINLLALLTHPLEPTRKYVDINTLWGVVDDHADKDGAPSLKIAYPEHWPVALFGDGEHDDHTVQVAVEQARTGMRVPITVQIPYDLWKAGQHATLAKRAEILADPDSRNAKAFEEANHPRAVTVASA